MNAEDKKASWLIAYAEAVRKALRGCKKKPSWQHLPYGHMAHGQRLSPKVAARRYLADTMFGKQKCAVKVR